MIRFSFGKFKNHTYKEIIEIDGGYDYLAWLLSQEWVKEKYPKEYGVLKRNRNDIEWSTYDESCPICGQGYFGCSCMYDIFN